MRNESNMEYTPDRIETLEKHHTHEGTETYQEDTDTCHYEHNFKIRQMLHKSPGCLYRAAYASKLYM